MKNTITPSPAKKQWQKPDFYLLDRDNIKGPGDKTYSGYFEMSIVFTQTTIGGVRKGEIPSNRTGFTLSNYVS